ncbi:MAG: tRNA uridine-5-carboxymethylaminomethyl(34) synthesis GTPase MnmE [Victivallales bacterium]|nr:tRNA uridine-5-carboxymethylaminomethyl(34) synthesis GTPase MnmE [Victivallales bacterium]
MIYDTNQGTIAALATAVGGALAVIRLSGPDSLAAARKLWRGRSALGRPNARKMLLGRLHDENGRPLDQSCLAVYFPGPESYTGEDVVELHGHGGALPMRRTLEALLRLGIRSAQPGEFTRRAFLNGKMDLTQAEAVSEVIAAESDAALTLANRQLAGELGAAIGRFYDRLKMVLAEVESHLDFPDEELDWQPQEWFEAELSELRECLGALASTQREGEVLRSGVSLVIAGAPNVGKSSLLNRLLGRERAIVSDIPGTTRDTVEAELVVRGIPLHLVDTAGIRDSADAIEASGMARTREAVATADLVLWLTDASERDAKLPWPGWPHRGVVLQVVNKCDLIEGAGDEKVIYISAKTGEGLEELAGAIEEAVLGRRGLQTGALAVSARHASLLTQADGRIAEAAPLLAGREWELAAIPLRGALDALGEITGRTASPDLLDTIFHRFCIGK